MLKLTTLLSITLFAYTTAQADASRKLQAYYGASVFKYSLNSEQFSAEQPATSGQAYLLNYAYKNHNSTLEHRIAWLNSSHEISVPASLTPSKINHKLTKINYQLVMSTDKFNFGAGYSFTKTEAGNTAPNMLLANSESHAVSLYIERDIWHRSDFSVQLFAALELPVIRKELGTNSGFNQTAYTAEIGYQAKFLLNDAWSIVQESEYAMTTTSFDGQGNRGTLNAKEKNQYINFLLGAGYDF